MRRLGYLPLQHTQPAHSFLSDEASGRKASLNRPLKVGQHTSRR